MQIQKILAGIAARSASGEFFYTRFFAIGLFRMLELTEARDPKALESLVSVRLLSHFRDVMCVTAQFKHRSQSWSQETFFCQWVEHRTHAGSDPASQDMVTLVERKTTMQSLGLKQELINKDLLLYKSILSKMSAAKELMAEFLSREKRKQAERDSEKAESKTKEETSQAAEAKKEEVKAEAAS